MSDEALGQNKRHKIILMADLGDIREGHVDYGDCWRGWLPTATSTFVDRGPCRHKAVCALGKQDFNLETTTPVDPGVIMLGASSDHLMLDVTDSDREYQVGDTVRLQLGYFSTMRAFTDDYVEKVYLD